MMRLDRFLCETGFGTRSEVKALLKKGAVTVNGDTVRRPEQKIDEKKDQICCNGKMAAYEDFVYIMLHKPAGVVSATEDRRERTVLDLLGDGCKRDIFPAGRLDKDTEGLLLLTNDGELAHQLLSPRKHVDKTYYVQLQGTLTEEHCTLFTRGLDIGDEKLTLPAGLKILKAGEKSEALVTIQEGRLHQVKRMFQAVGCEVTYLKRLSMGPLVLDETLERGSYRALTEQEVRQLKERNR